GHVAHKRGRAERTTGSGETCGARLFERRGAPLRWRAGGARRGPLLRAGEDQAEHKGLVRPGRLPEGDRARVRRTRRLGYAPRRLRLRRQERRRVRPCLHGARGRRLGSAHLRQRPGLPRHERHPQVRLREAKARLAPEDGERGGHRLLRPHRAHRGKRPGEHEDRGAQRRLRLGAEREEALDRPGDHRRRRRRLGPHRRGGQPRPGLPRPDGRRGLLRGGHHPEALDARLHPMRRHVRGREAPRGRHAPRGARASRALRLPQRGALRHHLGRHGGCQGLLRVCARVCRREGAVRQAHRLLPARATEARQHARRDRKGYAARLAHRQDERRRHASPRAAFFGQTQQRPRGNRGRAGGPHGLRRQRGHARPPADAPHGEPGKRANLRGHGRGPHPHPRQRYNRHPELPL
ncbi:MAG: Glutaryl-CoA dehydrogenase, partial [uncultured Rubrobacteraceae bacterium]